MWPALSERCRRNYLSHWLGKPILTLRKIIYSIYSHLLRILSIPIPYPIFFMFFLSWNPSKSFQIRCQDAANNIEPTTGIDIALPASKLHKFGLQFLSFRRAKSKPCLPATTLISETPNHLKNQTHFTTHTHTQTIANLYVNFWAIFKFHYKFQNSKDIARQDANPKVPRHSPAAQSWSYRGGCWW